MPSSHTLPPKENALFKRILKCYEQKQYKNGLKFSKQILGNQKFTEHGETLAMKGLILNCLGRKDEAYDYVRRGLRNDLRSHVCWHVYGLLQRSDKKYEEAIKCYRNALRWDKDNIQILRDLSLLQIQMRDLEGYKETRYTLFALRPTQRSSWIGFAMSYHLLEDYDMALKILGEFRETYEKTTYDFEHSELLLYQNLVIEESGDTEGALEHLNKYQEQICDKMTLLEVRGRYFLRLKRFEDAKRVYEDLIGRNPENHEYYAKLIEASNFSSPEEQLEMYDKFKTKYPRAQTPQRLALNVARGPSFRTLSDAYIRKAIRKGVPPLFVDLRSLYSDPEKVEILHDLMMDYLNNLLVDNSFDKGGHVEPATAILWVYYYLGQHYDHLEDHVKALKCVDDAIAHTPTLIELFLLKGKIYKHAGNVNEAVNCLDEAQSLDTADRYINCKCAKYLLRASKIKEAEEMCQKFTREGVSSMENLNEMQCMWFQTECAMASRRKGQLGDAIKKCIEVDRHFTDIIEDQFDFHTYCMRKMTLRSYVELLRLEDALRSHPFYEKLAHCAIDIYLDLYDSPLPDTKGHNEFDTENMDPSELKKLRNKQKKAQRKAEQEKLHLQQMQARKELHNKAQKKNEDEMDMPLKEELHPDKLERPADPLTEAIKFWTPLQNLLGDKLETQLKGFEIYYRKGKPLLMLRSIKNVKKILGSAYPPQFHDIVSKFHAYIESTTLSPIVKSVIQRETKDLIGSKTCLERNQDFLQANITSLEHLIVGTAIMSKVESSSIEAALKLVVNLDSPTRGVTSKNCRKVYEYLLAGIYGNAGISVAESYREKCSKLFPIALIFESPKNQS